MTRKIQSVFQFHDYRVLLLADFTARSTFNSRYSLRSYARDLKLSPGYISAVLRGKKNFSQVDYKDIFTRLGFNRPDELEYLEKLVALKVSPEGPVREEAVQYFREHYETLGLTDRSERDGILDSVSHLLIYMLIDKLREREKVVQLLPALGIRQERFDEVVRDLIARGYLRDENGALVVSEKDIAITSSGKVLAFATQLSQHFLTLMRESGGISFPERSTHSFVLGFDEESFKQAIEIYKQFLHQLYRVSLNTKKVDRITIFSDLLFTTPPLK